MLGLHVLSLSVSASYIHIVLRIRDKTGRLGSTIESLDCARYRLLIACLALISRRAEEFRTIR